MTRLRGSGLDQQTRQVITNISTVLRIQLSALEGFKFNFVKQ